MYDARSNEGPSKIVMLISYFSWLIQKMVKTIENDCLFFIFYFLFFIFVKFMPQYVVLKKLPILLILEFQLDILIA